VNQHPSKPALGAYGIAQVAIFEIRGRSLLVLRLRGCGLRFFDGSSRRAKLAWRNRYLLSFPLK